jgi:SAM-dependent methyltransferase
LTEFQSLDSNQQKIMPKDRSFEKIPPREFAASCREHASKWKVSAAIHPQDFIFHFIFKHPAFSNMDDAVRYYFDDARRSAELLKSILENDLSVNLTERKEMLEFASGYGAVTRHLRAVLPAFDITSSDIHPDANDFITKELSCKSIQSSSVPECFDAGGEYDLVFALSFFSHMPATTWSRWLSALFKPLRVGGSVIFTTHGPTSLRKIPLDASLDEEGFYFRPDSEQDDLEKTQYGTTCTSCRFVVDQIEALEHCELHLVRAGFWWGHQDLYVATKIADATISPVPDSNIYESDSKVEGHVESISVDEHRGVGRRRTMRIMGWATPNVNGSEWADSIIVVFRAKDGLQASCEPEREDRNDVASALKNPALVRTGFRATVDIGGLKGNMTLLLAVRCNTKTKLCHNVSIPLGCSSD